MICIFLGGTAIKKEMKEIESLSRTSFYKVYSIQNSFCVIFYDHNFNSYNLLQHIQFNDRVQRHSKGVENTCDYQTTHFPATQCTSAPKNPKCQCIAFQCFIVRRKCASGRAPGPHLTNMPLDLWQGCRVHTLKKMAKILKFTVLLFSKSFIKVA